MKITNKQRREDREMMKAVREYVAKRQFLSFEHSAEFKNSAGELMSVTITAKRIKPLEKSELNLK